MRIWYIKIWVKKWTYTKWNEDITTGSGMDQSEILYPEELAALTHGYGTNSTTARIEEKIWRLRDELRRQ